jgi:hypothetical protein
MAGLSDLITNTANQTTSMPAWYDTAQQNIVSQAGTAAGQAPSLQNTVAGQAISNLQGPNNPFMQAQGTLGQIASGAANPWIVDQSTGQVTPNTNTAMGGLFQAQNQQLNQLMPNYTAPVQGANIAGGNFGSLRGETAVNKAMGDAQAKLFADQMQAALQNQQTGVAAGTGLGNVGQQGTSAMTTLGQAQQSDPFTAAANYGKIVGGIQAPTTTSNRTQLSPLNTIGSLASAGSTGYNSLDQLLGGKLTSGLKGLLGIGSLNSGNINELNALAQKYGVDQGTGGMDTQQLFNTEAAKTGYTQEQLDAYQDYYAKGNPGYSGDSTTSNYDTNVDQGYGIGV